MENQHKPTSAIGVSNEATQPEKPQHEAEIQKPVTQAADPGTWQADFRTENLQFQQQKLNRELLEINRELKSAIQELELMNSELIATQSNLRKLVVRLSESESLKEIAIEQCKLGTWYINTETNEFVPSARLKEIFGYRPDQVMVADTSVMQIPAEYRSKILNLIEAAILQGKSYDLEYPITGYNDKQLHWVRATGKIYKSISGKPAHFSGTIMDMTEEINAKEELKKAEESLRMATDSAEMGTWLIHAGTRELITSARFKQIFGFETGEEISLASALAQVHEEYKLIFLESIDASINRGEKFNLDFPVTGFNNGKTRWVRSIGKLNYDNEGKPSHVTGVLHDITERKQDELRKNDFIGMVSHELKTPLTSLKGYIQLLHERAGKREDSFAVNALTKVNNQVNKMTTLINDFLNVSRFESGKIYLNKQIFSPDNLINEIIDDLNLLILPHSIHYECKGKFLLNADKDKIGAVISNLLSNAVKYSPDGKCIYIKCEQDKASLVVSVRDEGIGVSSNDLEKLFERYYRVENKLTNTISGFGIGLYLSAEIIGRHDGNIWAESDAGKGSVFYFSLPLYDAGEIQ